MPKAPDILMAIVLATALAPPAAHGQNDARKAAYGRHLAQQCTACHRTDGVSNGIPVITGWPADQFVAVLDSYKKNDRTNPAMVSIAQMLGDEEMQALASHFGAMKPPVAAAPPSAAGKRR